ncbi:hypothetical protein CANCADRAFT_16771, partial [Tortispora caseinolytica NRRL Y-17796]
VKRRPKSKSSAQWLERQDNDFFVSQAQLQGYRSRAAFKLLQINDKYSIFKPGQIVVDLGYSPGAWSQVALEKTNPGGHIVGVDLIAADPPPGVSAIQGDMLSSETHRRLKSHLAKFIESRQGEPTEEASEEPVVTEEIVPKRRRVPKGKTLEEVLAEEKRLEELAKNQVVDIVLSDMCEPIVSSMDSSDFYTRTYIDSVKRLQSTSGIRFQDHAYSVELCYAALLFVIDTLKVGGHFVCKYYAGEEDKEMKKVFSRAFKKVHRVKPESSRSKSREIYLVCLHRKPAATRQTVF